MNIYRKLIEVRKSCEYLKKDADGDRFKYVSSSKALGSLRGAMDEHGLLLVPSVIGNEVRRHENNIYKKDDIPKRQYFTILEMTFTWINADKPDEQVICHWTGHGLDDAEKGVGKAVTYAEKYFLLKFFNIATDKDDPDSYQQKQDPKPYEHGKGQQEQKPQKQDEYKGWFNEKPQFKDMKTIMLNKLISGETRSTDDIIRGLTSDGWKIGKPVRELIKELASEAATANIVDNKFNEYKDSKINELKKDMQHN